MGLTIHYDLITQLTDTKDIRQLVETMRQHALDMPFKEVGEVKEFTGDETDHHNGSEEDRWLKIQASGHLLDEQGHYAVIQPTHTIAFSTWPGEGSEPANFGFCKYTPHGSKRSQAAKLTGWSWASFCKTQYASDPKCGGVENFLRCHLCVVKLLDFIKQSDLVTVEVRDEGEYWEKRNLEALAKEVGDWNEQIAGFVSTLRTTAETDGKTVEAPITGFPNFEHLEAKGLERLADLRRRLKDGK